jgi:hypothetical protein
MAARPPIIRARRGLTGGGYRSVARETLSMPPTGECRSPRAKLRFSRKAVTQVLGFNKKSTVKDPELEAAVRARLEQDFAYLGLQKAAAIEHWDGIRERLDP